MTTDRGYPWLKIYPVLLENPKYLRLSDGARARYVECTLLAGKADAGGLVVVGDEVGTAEEIGFILRREPEQVAAELEELVKAKLLTLTDNGYCLAAFQEEQGPSQKDRREEWRERQARKRNRYSPGEQGQDEGEARDKEKEKERGEGEAGAQEGEVEEEEEEEVTRESRVTDSPPPPPPYRADARGAEAPSPSSKTPREIVLAQIAEDWQSYIGTRLPKKKQREVLELIHTEITSVDDWQFRWRECLSVWKDIAGNRGWSLNNPDAVIELYPMPNLEERMEREGFKWKEPDRERQRKELLRQHGLLNEQPEQGG